MTEGIPEGYGPWIDIGGRAGEVRLCPRYHAPQRLRRRWFFGRQGWAGFHATIDRDVFLGEPGDWSLYANLGWFMVDRRAHAWEPVGRWVAYLTPVQGSRARVALALGGKFPCVAPKVV